MSHHLCHDNNAIFAKDNYAIHWPQKIFLRKLYEFVAINLLPKNPHTLLLHRFQKDFTKLLFFLI